MSSRSKAVNSAAVLRCEFCVPDHAPAEFWNRQIGGTLVRRLSVSVVAAIGFLGALASTPAFAQVVPPTVLNVSVRRSPGELVTASDGGSLDLITYGSTATFSVTVQNTGPSLAQSVTLSGTAPTGPTSNPDGGTTTRITAVTPAARCTISGDASTFSCNLGDLPDGILADGGFLAATSTSSTFRITLALPPRPYGNTCTLPDGGPIAGNSLGPATVTASATNAPPVIATVSTTTTRPLADLAVTMTGPDTADEGSTIAYQVRAQNLGPCASNRVRLTNFNASNGLVFQGNSGTACTGGYPCVIASSWPAGASADITSTYVVDFLPVAMKQAGELQQVDIASTNTPNPDGGVALVFATPDPTLANNSAAITTSVSHDTGCSSVGTGSLGLLGVALALGLMLNRRRRS
jgi:uncharacterized repeat protein (TIGR01451 family)/uncharacterized protein (TIGR03382 family)